MPGIAPAPSIGRSGGGAPPEASYLLRERQVINKGTPTPSPLVFWNHEISGILSLSL